MYYSKCSFGYVLRLEFGEELQEALRHFAQATDIKGAHFQGIGALTQVELGFFCTYNKTYDRRFFTGEYELISLIGNLSLVDGVPLPHSHVCLGDKNYQTYSGHLFRGIVSVTVEIFITIVDLTLTRKEDPILKFGGLISPKRTHLKLTL